MVSLRLNLFKQVPCGAVASVQVEAITNKIEEMECNKDEASRAKEIVEKKFREKDIVGAKKFALKAQNLYPGLEGTFQLLATLDVYVSAENKINGETDWYGILGVDPEADDETVKKQYRKLALMLHPDKNKSIGADGAFKLVSEAWSFLSDKAKRISYDQKRNVKVPRHKVCTQSGCPSAPPGPKRSYNTTVVKKNTSKAAPSHVHHPPHRLNSNTFWTVCHGCKMQYEYLRVYLNHNLLCPCCREPFFAVEVEPAYTNNSSTTLSFSQQQQNSNLQTESQKTINAGSNSTTTQNVEQGGTNTSDAFNCSNVREGPFSTTTGASTVAQAATGVQQSYGKVKRGREVAQETTKREKNNTKRQRGLNGAGLGSNGRETTSQNGVGTAGATVSSMSESREKKWF